MHKLEVTGERSGYCRCGWRTSGGEEQGQRGRRPQRAFEVIPVEVLGHFNAHLDVWYVERVLTCPVNPDNGSECIHDYGHDGLHGNRGGEW